MLADDAATERMARSEAHLSRELDRTVSMLERLRPARPPRVIEGGILGDEAGRPIGVLAG